MPFPRQFGGIVPPVCTPLTADHELDVPSLERLIGFLLDAGVHGLFMLGSTGEAAALSGTQRQRVLDVAVRTVAGQVPVLAGVIDMGTAQVIDLARIAQRLGVDGLVATAPFYIRPSQREIVEHFSALKRVTDLPVYAYEVPPNVQSTIERSTIVAMAEQGLIAGLKDSSGAEETFRALLLDTREIDGFSAFTGSELLVDSALLMGAHGAVPGLGNVDPAGYVRIYTAIREGDLDRARCEQERLIRLFAIVHQATPGRTGHTASALGGFKTALQLRGVIATNALARPMTQLNEEETCRIRQLLIEADVL